MWRWYINSKHAVNFSATVKSLFVSVRLISTESTMANPKTIFQLIFQFLKSAPLVYGPFWNGHQFQILMGEKKITINGAFNNKPNVHKPIFDSITVIKLNFVTNITQYKFHFTLRTFSGKINAFPLGNTVHSNFGRPWTKNVQTLPVCLS
jgi:hypothetical protein